MHDLLRLAAELGVDVVERRGGKIGGYHAGTRTIRLNPGMSVRVARSVLAHELAHHIFGDEPSPYGPVRAKQERRAHEWAARRLITSEAYADAERARGGHTPSMAYDLGVTVEIVEAYRRLLTRLGDTVYVGARLGSSPDVERWDVA